MDCVVLECQGINASWKWNAIRDKIVQSSCDVVCLQETKEEAFDRQFLNNFCPSYLDAFVCLPSVGPLGVFLFFGKAPSFLGTRFLAISLGCLWNLTLFIMMLLGFLPVCMGPVLLMAKFPFLTGLKELKYQILLIG
jgi:hypothetical protein